MTEVKNVFEFVNDICNDKDYRFDVDSKSKYDAFMVNRALSQHADTIMYANEMNKYPFLNKGLQHDFLFYIVDKRKRYGKWAKAGKQDDEVLKLIINEYNVNQVHARQYLDLMTDDDIKTLKDKYDVGGKSR